jgi:threonine/homoserine/homoserine lactone efflux protein
MCDPHGLTAFLAAGIAVILAPGPAQVLVLARTLEKGRRAGMLTALGLNAATLVHAAAAGLGLSAVLAASALAFGIVKLVGAAYLVYLGVRALLDAPDGTPALQGEPSPAEHALLRAFVAGLLNPKVALFFLAFLPQFVCPSRGSVPLQFLAMGAALAVMDVVYEGGLVLVAAGATGWLTSARATRWRSRVTGGVLIALGAKLAFADRR